jgi:hypothetical protein
MKPEDLGRLAMDVAENNVRMVKVGMDSVEERYRPAIQFLEREFLASLIDQNTKMRTSLQLAIKTVIALCPSTITDRVNQYADAKIKQDQLGRHEGKPEHDLTTRGAPMKAGA